MWNGGHGRWSLRPGATRECTLASRGQRPQRRRLPLGDGTCRPAAMVQLLGDLWADGEPAWPAALGHPSIHLHLYGKAEARSGRKMGHLTCVGDDASHALQQAVDARVALSGR